MHVIGHVPFELTFEEASLPETQHFLGVPSPKDILTEHFLDRSSSWHNVDENRLEEIVRHSIEHKLAHTPTLATTNLLLNYRNYEEFSKADNFATRLAPPFYMDVVWSPTEGLPTFRNISAQDLQKVEESLVMKKNLLYRLHLAGADLYLGSDLQLPFVIPGLSLHQEMNLWYALSPPL